MASNGSKISERSWFSWHTVVLLLSIAFGAGGLGVMARAHYSNCDIHHSVITLDARYANKDAVTEGFAALEKRLTRIEDKIDRHMLK